MDVFRTLAAPNQYGPLQANLSGDWTIERGPSVLNRADGRIAFRFLRKRLLRPAQAFRSESNRSSRRHEH
jgi:hypothetical protein